MERPWGTINIEYYSGTDNIKYIGKAIEVGAPDNHKSFYVSFLEYDSDDNITKILGPVLNQWSKRAELF
jgi:hypothetical protein